MVYIFRLRYNTLIAWLILAACPAFYYEITITTILTKQEEAFGKTRVFEYSFASNFLA